MPRRSRSEARCTETRCEWEARGSGETRQVEVLSLVHVEDTGHVVELSHVRTVSREDLP